MMSFLQYSFPSQTILHHHFREARPPIMILRIEACVWVRGRVSHVCLASVSRRLTASPADMRFEGTLSQHRSIICHIRFGISRWLGRGGLVPLSMENVAAISVMSKKGGRPVRTCLA